MCHYHPYWFHYFCPDWIDFCRISCLYFSSILFNKTLTSSIMLYSICLHRCCRFTTVALIFALYMPATFVCTEARMAPSDAVSCEKCSLWAAFLSLSRCILSLRVFCWRAWSMWIATKSARHCVIFSKSWEVSRCNWSLWLFLERIALDFPWKRLFNTATRKFNFLEMDSWVWISRWLKVTNVYSLVAVLRYFFFNKSSMCVSNSLKIPDLYRIVPHCSNLWRTLCSPAVVSSTTLLLPGEASCIVAMF